MAIGYIKKKVVEGVETLVPETTAGPSAGTVRKLSFDCNIDYAVPITADETGEGYVGVSGNCKLSFNPKYNIGTVADPEYIGVLKADCFCGKGTNTEIADCVEIGEVCQNLNYKVPFTCNCEVLTACSQNLLYNPNTGLLCTNCMCVANNLEVLCDVCADEYKSRTAGVGITVDTTAEDNTLDHNGDVIYKGCNGELATSNCNDFKFNPSTGTLTVDHVCSCDVQNEIKDSKLCNTGTSSICYCSSAKAHDNAAVAMHAYRCEVGSNNPRESYATLDYDGFYLTCVPFCQADGSGSTYTRAQIGYGCDIWETQVCLTDCTRAYRCGSCAGLCEGVRVTDSNGCLLCGTWTNITNDRVCMAHTRTTSSGCCCYMPRIEVFSLTNGGTASISNRLVDCDGDDVYNAGMLVGECTVLGYVGDGSARWGEFLLDCDGVFKVSNSSTGGWARVLTECDAGNSCILKNPSWSNTCLKFEEVNELNLYGNSRLWLNYRGGGTDVSIGNGCGDNGYGCLLAGYIHAEKGIHAFKGGNAANTNVAGFCFNSYTQVSGYDGGAYIGHCNANYDGYWGYATFGFYNAENDTLCAGICVDRLGNSFFHDAVHAPTICTQTICFY